MITELRTDENGHNDLNSEFPRQNVRVVYFWWLHARRSHFKKCSIDSAKEIKEGETNVIK